MFLRTRIFCFIEHNDTVGVRLECIYQTIARLFSHYIIE